MILSSGGFFRYPAEQISFYVKREGETLIKENQKLLNILQLVIDAVIIAASFLLAYDLRFDDTWSPLIKHHII